MYRLAVIAALGSLLALGGACSKKGQGQGSQSSSTGASAAASGAASTGSGAAGGSGASSGSTGGGSTTGRGTVPLCHPCQAHGDCQSGYCNAWAPAAAPYCDTRYDCTAASCGSVACLASGACDCHPEQYFASDTGSTGGDGDAGWHDNFKGCEGCLIDADCLNGGHCAIAQGAFAGHCEGASCTGAADCGHSPGLVGVCQQNVCVCQSSGSSGSSGSTGSGAGPCAPCATNADCDTAFCNTFTDPAHPYCDSPCDASVDGGDPLCGGYACATSLCVCPGHSSTSGSTGGSTGGTTSGSTGGTGAGPCAPCSQDSDCATGFCNPSIDPSLAYCDNINCSTSADCGGYACNGNGNCACPNAGADAGQPAGPDGGAGCTDLASCTADANCGGVRGACQYLSGNPQSPQVCACTANSGGWFACANGQACAGDAQCNSAVGACQGGACLCP